MILSSRLCYTGSSLLKRQSQHCGASLKFTYKPLQRNHRNSLHIPQSRHRQEGLHMPPGYGIMGCQGKQFLTKQATSSSSAIPDGIPGQGRGMHAVQGQSDAHQHQLLHNVHQEERHPPPVPAISRAHVSIAPVLPRPQDPTFSAGGLCMHGGKMRCKIDMARCSAEAGLEGNVRPEGLRSYAVQPVGCAAIGWLAIKRHRK